MSGSATITRCLPGAAAVLIFACALVVPAASAVAQGGAQSGAAADPRRLGDYQNKPKPEILERCEVYQAQFDKKRKKFDNDPAFAEAIRLRRLGERLCNVGYTVHGQRVLKAALERANSKPEKVPQDPGEYDPSRKNARELR